MKLIPASVDDVVVEVTRRCNLTCSHCLRGAAQDVDLQPNVSAAIWHKIGHIGTVTLTGGEPLLNPSGIKNFVDAMKAAGGSVGRYYIATNGYVFNEEVCAAVAYAFGSVEEPDLNSLQVSNTAYHVDSGRADHGEKRQEQVYRSFKNVLQNVCLRQESSPDMTNPGYTASYRPNLLARGRAKYRESASDDLTGGPWDIEGSRIGNRHLYVTVHGCCFPFCDLSYLDLDELIANRSPLYLGNITDPRHSPYLMAKKWNDFVNNCGGTVKVRDHV